MIVVGVLRPGGSSSDAVRAIATAAAGSADRSSRIEIVGVLPGDAAGDAALLELSAAGVGHAAIVRSPASDLEPADLDLALRYLPDLRVVVLVEPDEALIATAASAAAWATATLILVTSGGEDGVPMPRERTIVIAPPSSDPDGTFAGFVAALALRLDAGESIDAAWRSTIDRLAVDRVSIRA